MKSFTLSLAVCAFLAAADALGVTIDWSPVGNPGNAADPADGDNTTPGIQNFGRVNYAFNIGTYDVTDSQYVEFLNTKDSSGMNSLRLYDSRMTTGTGGGINYNSGSANGTKYTVISGDGNHPVNFVDWYDAIRFANWLNNGQGNGDTETGAYTLGALGAGGVPINGDSITRNAGATVFLPSQGEWYKAAYYDPRTTAQGGPPSDSHYWLYPTSSNTKPTGSGPTPLPNHANIPSGGLNNLTDVGAYSGTTSPYGAFDMGGNVYQWNEALISAGSLKYRGLRGGSFDSGASQSSELGSDSPAFEFSGALDGFRLANIPNGFVPEPSSLVLAALGFIALVAYGVVRASIAQGARDSVDAWPIRGYH